MKRDQWDKRYAAEDLVWSAEPNQFLVAEVAALAPGRALDVAAGEGRNALWLADRGWDVVAVDFSRVGVRKAREIASDRGIDVNWRVADVREYRPLPYSFDLVIVLYLHMPWSDMQATLRAATQGLAQGGIFLLIGHDITNLLKGHGGPQNPAVLYSAQQIADELTGLGSYRIDKAETVYRRIKPQSDSATHMHIGSVGDRDAYAIDNLVRAVRIQGDAPQKP